MLMTELATQASSESMGFERCKPTVARVFGRQPVERLAAGQALFWEGDPAEHIFEVVDGVLRLCRVMLDGRRAIVGFLFPGDVLGLSFREGYLHTAEAVTPVSARRFHRGQFEALFDHSPELGRQLFAMMCDELSSAREQMLLLARKNAQERVATFLSVVARRLFRLGATRSRSVILPMTRQDMADYLGLTIETVSRVMTRLKSEGVIALPDPQRLIVLDHGALSELTGDHVTDRQGSQYAGGARPHKAWAH